MQVAALVPRFLAYIIDFAILLGLLFLFGFHLYVLLIFWVLMVICEGSALRATPGKLIIGLDVEYEQLPRAFFAIYRNTLKVPAHIFFVGFLSAFYKRNRKTAYDIAAGTRVVYRPNVAISVARRSWAVSVLLVGAALITGITVVSELAEILERKGPFNFSWDWRGSSLTPPQAEALIRDNYDVRFPAPYRAVWARRWYTGIEQELTVGFSQTGRLKEFADAEGLLDLLGTDGSQAVWYFICIQESPFDDSGSACFSKELAPLVTNRQTVFHQASSKRLRSLKMDVEVDGEAFVAYKSTIAPRVTLLTLGRKDQFNLSQYLEVLQSLQ